MQIKSFSGIRNTVPARSIPDNALADASDVFLDHSGVLTQRRGYASSLAMSISTAYSTLDQAGYVVSGGYLYRVLDDLTTLRLAASTATQFCDFGKTLWTNDGLRVRDDRAISLKLTTPTIPLTLHASSGDLPAGKYSATYTLRASSGLESGSAPIATIELTDTGGIQIDPPDGDARIYMTDGDGEVFYAVDNGVQLPKMQVLANPFPDDAEHIAYFQARLYVSKTLPTGGSIVWRSDPFMHHLFDYQREYFIVPGQIRAMMPSNEALIIGTDAAIYAYADGVQQLASYGVVPGRPMRRHTDGTVYIYTQRGVCKALPFENLTMAKVSLAPGDECSTQFVEQDGTILFVALNNGLGTPYNVRT